MWYRAVSDFGAVNTEDADAELGLVAGVGDDGVAVGHALNGGDEHPRGWVKIKSHEKWKRDQD